MKNSQEYARKVRKLHRSLKRKYPKVQAVSYDEPVDAVVYAVISESMSETATRSAMKKFADYFIDWNDLRVARPEEILEVLGEDTDVTRDTASTLYRILMAVFNEYNAVSLAALKKLGKRPAKQMLEKLEGMSHFALNYCMLTSLHGHAIPLTQRMIEYLRRNELVGPEADEQQIEGFLTRQIPAKNGYEFYALLRRESESSARARKKKTKKKTKRKTKTKKKTKRKAK
jgi:endonuclease III